MNRKILHEGKYRRFILHQGWEFVERVGVGGIVVIIAVTEKNELVLVEQHRVPVGKAVIEFPAGLANDQEDNQHESLEETARRELLEETGFQAQEMRHIMDGPASSSTSSDILSIYFAPGVKRVGPGGGDETENITVHVIPLTQTETWLAEQSRQGKLIDTRIYAGLYYLAKLG